VKATITALDAVMVAFTALAHVAPNGTFIGKYPAPLGVRAGLLRATAVGVHRGWFWRVERRSEIRSGGGMVRHPGSCHALTQCLIAMETVIANRTW
jgi:hypothetical protein